ncbi:hypothetical protein RRG08_020188 [Elysia crispata]|uniref:Uncharacterized protein n=1 Tax=Elysia crispata TaxID=231223 RepID=A0AAE1A202_9GAST|nr:hypothetical protein RRG08_020188 [Elysia crispata]
MEVNFALQGETLFASGMYDYSVAESMCDRLNITGSVDSSLSERYFNNKFFKIVTPSPSLPTPKTIQSYFEEYFVPVVLSNLHLQSSLRALYHDAQLPTVMRCRLFKYGGPSSQLLHPSKHHKHLPGLLSFAREQVTLRYGNPRNIPATLHVIAPSFRA